MPKARMFARADSAESSNNSSNQPNPLPPMRLERIVNKDNAFVCYRCPKSFTSLFALGGHQNAHKKERNEELRAYIGRRVALERQASSSKPPAPPVAIATAVPVNVINSMPFHGPIVQQPPLLVPAAGGYRRPKAAPPVLFLPDGMFGPYGRPTKTPGAVKGGEGNQYSYHPCYKKKAVNKQSMALKLFAYEERDFGGNAEEDTASSTAATAAPFADYQINTSEEELDLTLRL